MRKAYCIAFPQTARLSDFYILSFHVLRTTHVRIVQIQTDTNGSPGGPQIFFASSRAYISLIIRLFVYFRLSSAISRFFRFKTHEPTMFFVTVRES